MQCSTVPTFVPSTKYQTPKWRVVAPSDSGDRSSWYQLQRWCSYFRLLWALESCRSTPSSTWCTYSVSGTWYCVHFKKKTLTSQHHTNDDDDVGTRHHTTQWTVQPLRASHSGPLTRGVLRPTALHHHPLCCPLFCLQLQLRPPRRCLSRRYHPGRSLPLARSDTR